MIKFRAYTERELLERNRRKNERALITRDKNR